MVKALMTNHYLAIIPARKGSKGLVRKNMANLGGKPLIEWTIDAALRSESFSDIIVTTDDESVKELAEKKGVQVLERPAHLASDEAGMLPVIDHVLENVVSPVAFMLLQPTSPFRSEEHICSAISYFENSGLEVEGLISVQSEDPTILKCLTLRDGWLDGIVDNKTSFMRRQDLPLVFKPNGAIFLSKTASYLRTQSLLSERTIPFVMNSQESLDVDSDVDLRAAEKLLVTRC